jgi:hypothetical protein
MLLYGEKLIALRHSERGKRQKQSGERQRDRERDRHRDRPERERGDHG